MRNLKWLEEKHSITSLHSGPFILSWAPTCDACSLKCSACLCAKVTTRTTKVASVIPMPAKRNILKRAHLEPGCCIFVDHYCSSEMGHLPHTFGQEPIGYFCSLLFDDHASRKIFNFCQYSKNPIETIQSKCPLESLARQEGITIHKYHTDYGAFSSKAFKENCALMGQKNPFSVVGAHHQNGVAERNIKTVAQWACANMLHFAHHWPSQAHVRFWPQAIDYALWVFNRLPYPTNGLSPNKLWLFCHASTEEFN
jgi:hypothetical protein